MLNISCQMRTAAKCFLAQRHLLLHPRLGHNDLDQWRRRHFSHTCPRQAMEDTESIVTRLPSSPLTKQIANQPEALKALNDFFALLKESAIDISPNQPPSMIQLYKLSTNPKIMVAAKKVMDELKAAGVDINSENAFELFGLKPPSR